MANDPIKQIQDAINKINKVVDDSLSRSNMNILAKEAAQDMKERTRQGYGVNNNEGNEFVLKPLTITTISIREDLQLTGELSSYTTPSKSNVTRTGEMTESINGKSINKGKGRIELSGSRNKDVAGELEQGGRTFFNLSRKEVNSIAKSYGLLFAKEFSKILTKK